MRKILIIVAMCLFTYFTYGQHRYLVVIDKIENADSAQKLCKIFMSDLSATECTYSDINNYFKVTTKNFLPRMIVEDYMSALGYRLGLFLEVDDKPQLFRMPAKKDTIMAN